MPSSDNFIRLSAIDRDRHAVYFPFECGAAIEHLLWPERELTIYCSEGVNSSASHLATAFLLAMAPLRWICGTRIELPFGIDERAVAALQRTGDYLSDYYGWPIRDLAAGQATRSIRTYAGVHRGLMFSAGVDSMTALVDFEEDLDWLIHVSNFENLDSRVTEAQRQEALIHTHAVAESHGLGWMHVRTNIPSVFIHNQFDERFPETSSFWLGLEHVHHLATALCVQRVPFKEVLLAGGFNDLLQRTGSCAANADFIDTYRWPQPMRLVHETTLRQKKIEHLLREAPERLRQLRVCFTSGDGTCAHCRKCQATFLMILSAGGRFHQTNFPPEILQRAEEKIHKLSILPAEGHAFFNESLTGAALSGSRSERWAQLLNLVLQEKRAAEQEHRAGAQVLGYGSGSV